MRCTDTNKVYTDEAWSASLNIFGYKLTSSPFMRTAEVEEIRDLSSADIENIYNTVVTETGERSQIIVNRLRVKSYLISSTQKINTLRINYSGDFSDQKHTPFVFRFLDEAGSESMYPQVQKIPVYYRRVTITFP